MAALKTALADAFEPDASSAYFVESLTKKSDLVQSGIMATDPYIESAVQAGAAGKTVDLPFWKELPHNTDATTISKVGTDTDAVIAPAGITSGTDVAAYHSRNQSFEVANVVEYIAGDDPARVVVDGFADWWLQEEQRLFLLTLSGIFSDSTIASEHSLDISGETDPNGDAAKLIGSDAITDARFLLGDAFGKFTGMMMHSTPFKRLDKIGLIENVPVKDQQGLLVTKPQYRGLDVIVNDLITTAAGASGGTKYHTFLFGRGAFARQDVSLRKGGSNLILVDSPLAGNGSGSLTMLTRRRFVMHPRGIAYVGSLTGKVSPADADLSGENWNRVYTKKNIRIARLITNG